MNYLYQNPSTMKTTNFIILFIFSLSCLSQTEADLIKEIKDHQAEENNNFSDPETSILEETDLAKFKALDFYPIDLKYRVKAKLVRTPNEKPFKMRTTTERLPEYVKYGEAHFTIDGEKLKLNVYKSTSEPKDPKYKDYLFIPFTDYTSGDGAYGGGRYVDAWIPEGDILVIDFNKAYNPYCAYNKKYSCPIPPRENDLKIRIEAGVKDFGAH